MEQKIPNELLGILKKDLSTKVYFAAAYRLLDRKSVV
jgi:hypothetical protein